MKLDLSKKLFYKIGEVAGMLEVEPYVLRYWEGEFHLKLSKSKNQQRLYQKKDIDQLSKIRTLLYDEKFTIAGAKKKLREKKPAVEAHPTGQLSLSLPPPDHESKRLKETLLALRKEIEEIRSFL